MKTFIAFSFLLLATAYAVEVVDEQIDEATALAEEREAVHLNPQSFLKVGQRQPGDHMLSSLQTSSEPSVFPWPMTYRKTFQGSIITSVVGYEVGPTQHATASLAEGGPGTNSAAVVIRNAPGFGYTYRITYYGHSA